MLLLHVICSLFCILLLHEEDRLFRFGRGLSSSSAIAFLPRTFPLNVSSPKLFITLIVSALSKNCFTEELLL